jgi:transposase
VQVGRQKPEEICDAEHEMLIERVCAIDVAKASGKVRVRAPHESRPGRRASRVWDVPATTRAILELGDHLVCEQVEKVTVESTSDYWRIWYYLLESRGLDVQLVNSREVKNVPGRPKTDLLTELRGESSQLSSRVVIGTAMFRGHDRGRGYGAGPVWVGGSAVWVA